MKMVWLRCGYGMVLVWFCMVLVWFWLGYGFGMLRYGFPTLKALVEDSELASLASVET